MGMVLGEANYKEQMESVVLPYNKERETQSYPERESGKALHLAVYCADHAKAGVVISHGYTESIVKYQEVIYYFLQAGYNVYMAEHCGHGRSYRLTEDLSLVTVDCYERYVDDLIFVARKCKEAYPDLPMYLFAHSMGGGIGAATIAVEPLLFQKAILTSPMIRPATGGIPWGITKKVAKAGIQMGKSEEYAVGQKPYDGQATFEGGCTTSRARFDYYKELQDQDPYLQTCAASYSWISEAIRLNTYLRREGWKKVQIPILLFQAENEELVSKSEQNRYVERIARAGNAQATMICVPETKHEIFNSTEKIQEPYWKHIFRFFR